MAEKEQLLGKEPTPRMIPMEVHPRFTIWLENTLEMQERNRLCEKLGLMIIIGGDTENILKTLNAGIVFEEPVRQILELGKWRYVGFYDTKRYYPHAAFIRGDITTNDPLLVRFHSSFTFGEQGYLLASDDRMQLDQAFKEIHEKGRGMVIWLNQDGAGNGISAVAAQLKLTDQGIPYPEAFEILGVKPESRSFQMATDFLRIYVPLTTPIQLMTENVNKRQELADKGYTVIPYKFHVEPLNITQKELKKAKTQRGTYEIPPAKGGEKNL